jgi:acetyl esterase/lipase
MRNLWLIMLPGVCCVSLTFAAEATPAKPQQKTVAAPVPADVKVLKDIEYAKVGDRKLPLDLYLPEKAEGKLPVIVWIHGGGWRSGSKEEDCLAVQTGFVQKGYAVASVEYRLSDEAIFPAQIEDCKSAIRWLRANADKYNLDPSHIGAWGFSAGGHLVALLGTTGDIKDFDKGENLNYSSAVQAVCIYSGPIDFPTFVTTPGYEKHAGPESAETKLIGGRVLDNPEKAKEVSATSYVSKGDAPTLIIHGDKDPTVPIGQGKLFYDALKKAEVNVIFHPIQDAKHNLQQLSTPEIISGVDSFFREHLFEQSKDEKQGKTGK